MANRELRRLQRKEEERQRRRRQQGVRPRKKERAGILQFFREVRQELKRVAWPSREEVTTFTLVVLITSGFVAAFVFGLDLGLKNAVLWVVEKF